MSQLRDFATDDGDLPTTPHAQKQKSQRTSTDERSQELDACRQQGNACRERGDLIGAIANYDRVLQVEPADFEALNGLGITLAMQDKTLEAINVFDRAITAFPESAQAYHNLGVALATLERLSESIECFRNAIQRKPDYAEAYMSLGNALSALGDNQGAVGAYKESLRFSPNCVGALNGLGVALTALKRSAEATMALQQAIRLQSDFAGTYNNLGVAYTEEGRYSDAETAFENALRLNPNYAEAHTNLGNTFKEVGRLSEASTCYDIAIWLSPDLISARWNRALALLQAGDFQEGWHEYEWRHKRKGVSRNRRTEAKEWDGSSLNGQTILVQTEQGLGDVLQFIRYASMLKSRGATVVVESPPPLLRILSYCPAIDQVAPEGAKVKFDFSVPLMSLPRLFETRLDSIPADIPYLFPEDARVSHWRGEFDKISGYKIGIAWQGNPHHQWDRHRSLQLSIFRELGELAGVHLISLQRGPGTEQLDSLTFPVIDVLDRSLSDSDGIAETAAIVKCLDLVITVDTAVAHLAGAIGSPVWVVLSTMVDWRWMLNRDDTPWYPRMRLFRQSTRGDWKPVFRRLAEAVRNLSANRHVGSLHF
jgi:tetratricopeptide (TPR) repeat protein